MSNWRYKRGDCKILRKPETVKLLSDLNQSMMLKQRQKSSHCCIPAGMEIMDKALTRATDDHVKAGYPETQKHDDS